MTRAVISGSLVDAKNVQTHKSVRLYIDVPAELGEQIVKMFGWPTMAAPVPVAIARLVAPPQQEPANKGRQWEEISPAEQAGIRCHEWQFRRFLKAKDLPVHDEKSAAETIRVLCRIDSRRDLNTNEQAAQKWREIDDEYQRWQARAA